MRHKLIMLVALLAFALCSEAQNVTVRPKKATTETPKSKPTPTVSSNKKNTPKKKSNSSSRKQRRSSVSDISDGDVSSGKENNAKKMCDKGYNYYHGKVNATLMQKLKDEGKI